jgi:hypothetical protein
MFLLIETGRGNNTHAYTHSVGESHHVFLNLHTLRFYCLPDNYEIIGKFTLLFSSMICLLTFENVSGLEVLLTHLLPKLSKVSFIKLVQNCQCQLKLIKIFLYSFTQTV